MPQKTPFPPTAHSVLAEFVNDIEAWAATICDADPDRDMQAPGSVADLLENHEEGWADLADTYRKAKNVLARFPQPVKRFIQDGEIGGVLPCTTDDLLEDAGNLLDRACSGDILGDVMFEGDDGVIYVMTVEAVIGAATPEYVRDVESELEQEAEAFEDEEIPPYELLAVVDVTATPEQLAELQAAIGTAPSNLDRFHDHVDVLFHVSYGTVPADVAEQLRSWPWVKVFHIDAEDF